MKRIPIGGLEVSRIGLGTMAADAADPDRQPSVGYLPVVRCIAVRV
jgi:aryl-alcohol dehydrogenase-like predicted oxidoreductase